MWRQTWRLNLHKTLKHVSQRDPHINGNMKHRLMQDSVTAGGGRKPPLAGWGKASRRQAQAARTPKKRKKERKKSETNDNTRVELKDEAGEQAAV